jgi:hypothetical protein
MSYFPVTPNRSGEILAAGTMQAAQTNQQMMSQLGSDIGGALASIGNMYGKAQDKKRMLGGMDKAVSAMSDMGAITTDFRDKYMAVDQEIRPFLFEAIASPMFKSYTAGQSAAAQAQAWDKYKKTWGSDAGGEPQGWTIY